MAFFTIPLIRGAAESIRVFKELLSTRAQLTVEDYGPQKLDDSTVLNSVRQQSVTASRLVKSCSRADVSECKQAFVCRTCHDECNELGGPKVAGPKPPGRMLRIALTPSSMPSACLALGQFDPPRHLADKGPAFTHEWENKHRFFSHPLQYARINLGHVRGRYDHINRCPLAGDAFELQLPVNLLRTLVHAHQSPVGS